MRMFKILITAATLFPIAALAQEPVKDFNLKISPTEVQILGEALGMLPYGKVAPLMQKLQVQINEQNLPPPPVAAAIKPEEKK